MKKIVSRLTLMFAVAMLLVCMTPVMASAKTVKLKKHAFTTSTAEAESVAKPVKTGTETVKVPKKGQGFLKFTAPATKPYSFKVSNIKAGRYCCGYFYVMTKYGTGETSIGQQKLATKGGETSGLFVATKNSKVGAPLYRFLKSRTGVINLQAGQTVYIYFSMTKNCTLKLKIK